MTHVQNFQENTNTNTLCVINCPPVLLMMDYKKLLYSGKYGIWCLHMYT